ncbi:MAG TPA: hypothetical protein VFG42_12005 [Baekduia sp.]|uniref:hypothetical protein n=1 Tax=Baekduia sp. TaxID=2600305 RepID=UPI002D77FFE0|nr:hypothetical protein [Baekduia sp.]HET6507502.1 hypothetical protein [Baekduia sp.]
MRTLVIALALLLPPAAAAEATQLSYVDQGQVWVSTLDGAQKRAISGPAPVVAPGESRAWTEQAQSDDGWIVAVARVSGGTGAAAPTRVWSPDGAVAAQSTLGYHGAYNNGSLAVPVQLDLGPGGQQMIYTYSDMVYGYPTSTLYQGTWATNTSNSSGEPFDVPSLIGSSLVGSRWVGVNGNAGTNDDNVVVEAAGGQAPFSTTFTPWFHATGAWSVDVAANGSVAAVIYQLDNNSPYALGLFAANGVGAPLPGPSCDVPAVGGVHAVSVSQDGRWLAWVDDRGLVTAALAPITTSPCPLGGAPTVISATGSYPSLGATTLATPIASPATGTSPARTSPSSPSPSPSKPTVTVPKTVKASAFAKGLTLAVTVKRQGTVTAIAKVGATALARATTKAKDAGTVKLRLKASKRLARRLSRYRGKTLTLTVRAPGGVVAVTRRLR